MLQIDENEPSKRLVMRALLLTPLIVADGKRAVRDCEHPLAVMVLDLVQILQSSAR